ncbi:hypothetical protein [Chamaesiphon minutus]|nr:hypothetical protein [Chamaesiphon minutus]
MLSNFQADGSWRVSAAMAMFSATTLPAGLTQMSECWLRLLYPLVF